MPKQKNSASCAMTSAVSAALGISIIVPTSYFNSTPAAAISAFAVSTTIFLTNFSSLSSPINGIIISGTIFQSECFFCTLIAARMTAFVCIFAISGYVTDKRQPRCPIIGLNSCKELMSVLISSTVFPFLSAKARISVSSVGTNSCNGGSRKRMVTGFPSKASYSFSKSLC